MDHTDIICRTHAKNIWVRKVPNSKWHIIHFGTGMQFRLHEAQLNAIVKGYGR